MSNSSAPTTEPSQRRKTALAVIKCYEDWNISSIMSLRSPGCTHQVLPKSLGRPLMDNEAYEAYFSAIMPYFRDFKVSVNDLFEDERENKVVLWARSTADTDIGPYANEYMLMFYMNEAGDRVDRFLEFVDASVSIDFFPKLRKYIAENAKQD